MNDLIFFGPFDEMSPPVTLPTGTTPVADHGFFDHLVTMGHLRAIYGHPHHVLNPIPICDSSDVSAVSLPLVVELSPSPWW